MNKLLLLAIAAAALAACDNSDGTTTGSGDSNVAEANTVAIVLPPAISASKTYRCSGDNSVIYIDWYSDGSARVKSSQTDIGTQIPVPEEGAKSLLGGSAETSSVTYAGKTCNA